MLLILNTDEEVAALNMHYDRTFKLSLILRPLNDHATNVRIFIDELRSIHWLALAQ
jgi:hypothetical protein